MNSRTAALLFAVLAALSLSGCATMAGWVGIASSESVDEKLAGTRGQLETEIGSLRSELDVHQARVAEIEDLSSSMEDAIQKTEELEQLAEVMAARLEQMPRDTIQELVEILQRYLEESE